MVPGNVFVTLAKKKLFGEVGIYGIFGPSETVIVADAHASIKLVAADMVAGGGARRAGDGDPDHGLPLALAEDVGAVILTRSLEAIERADVARTKPWRRAAGRSLSARWSRRWNWQVSLRRSTCVCTCGRSSDTST